MIGFLEETKIKENATLQNFENTIAIVYHIPENIGS